MSFLLPDDDDDNPFANAVSPFATFTPPPSTSTYGQPLPTPDVGHTPGPYVQALDTASPDDAERKQPAAAAATGGDRLFDGEDDDGGEGFGSAGRTPVELASNDDDDARAPSPSPSSPPAHQPAPASPDAFSGGFHPSSSSSAFAVRRPSSPPPFLGRPITPPPSAPAAPLSPADARTAKREAEAALADLLGESEEARLKGAFRKGLGGPGSPARKSGAAAAPAQGSPKAAANAAADDDDDPFGALVRKRAKSGKQTGSGAAAAAVGAQAPKKAAAAPAPASSAAPAAAPPAINTSVASTSADAGAGVSPASLPLPASEPPTAPSTPRPSSPPPTTAPSSSAPPAPTPPPSTDDVAETADSSARPSVAVSPLVAPSPLPTPKPVPRSRSSSPARSDDADDNGAGAGEQHGAPRVERSFSELTLDGGRAAELGLGPGGGPGGGGGGGGGLAAGATGGWGAPGGGGGEWGGEEERLVLGGESGALGEQQEVEEVEEDEPAPASPTLAPAPVDKDFVASAAKTSELYVVHVADPTKVGLGTSAHIVYTVSTSLRVNTEYGSQQAEVAVLRRFSDFLWLGEALREGNRGVVVPPVPDKQSFGRFADEFVAHRRAQLQTFLAKTAAHAVLQLDPLLRAFLTADNWAGEMKHWTVRRSKADAASAAGEKGYLAGLTSGLTGSKFVERDPWFDERKAVLDTLEGQLKALVKSVELVSKQRLDLSAALADFSTSIGALAQCDLSRPMALALERFAGVLARTREREDANGRADVGAFMATADEYIRLIGSVRNAFSSRVKAHGQWLALEADARRLAGALDKARRQGKVAAERVGQEIALVADAERKAKESGAEFDAVTRLVKNEVARFEDERVADFKAMLEAYVEGMIRRQKTLIAAYEEYHASLVRLVQQSQPAPPQQRKQQQQQQAQPLPASPVRETNGAVGGGSPERSLAFAQGGFGGGGEDGGPAEDNAWA